jgi:hypothetical protein
MHSECEDWCSASCWQGAGWPDYFCWNCKGDNLLGYASGGEGYPGLRGEALWTTKISVLLLTYQQKLRVVQKLERAALSADGWIPMDTNWYRVVLLSYTVRYKVARADAMMSCGGVNRHVILTLALDEANSSAYFWPQRWSPRWPLNKRLVGPANRPGYFG